MVIIIVTRQDGTTYRVVTESTAQALDVASTAYAEGHAVKWEEAR